MSVVGAGQAIVSPAASPTKGFLPKLKRGSLERRRSSAMRTIYIDADACPVKDEIYRVARRYAMRVVVVANAALRVPADALLNWWCVQASARRTTGSPSRPGRATSSSRPTYRWPPAAWRRRRASWIPRGSAFTDSDIGSALAMRELMDELRQGGA